MALAYGTKDASYQAAGGQSGIRRLVDAFYDEMDSADYATTIRSMHPQDLTISRDKLSLFLCGWLGGPRLYAEKYGGISIPSAHAHLDIGLAERDAWLACMKVALDKQDYEPAFKIYLLEQLSIPAERVRKRD